MIEVSIWVAQAFLSAVISVWVTETWKLRKKR